MSTTAKDKAAEERIAKLRQERADEFAKAPPSRVIEMALEDLEAVQKHKDDYIVDMGYWHRPAETTDHAMQKSRDKCVVCFAGSVMANSLGCDKKIDMAPWEFTHDVAQRLSALNEFRLGLVEEGLTTMDIDMPDELRDIVGLQGYIDVPDFTPNKPNARFKTSMRKLVDLLRSHGL